MYNSPRNITIGFHGCEKSVADAILGGDIGFHFRKNKYDWLGHGMYFWEGNEARALEFAKEKKKRGDIQEPAVIGTILDMGRCLNLLDSEHLQLLKVAHETLRELRMLSHEPMPKNKGLFRDLDCDVLEHMHLRTTECALPSFDTVRGMFPEGEELYEGAGFRDKNHIQICVRNPNCILGFFRPKKPDVAWPAPGR